MTQSILRPLRRWDPERIGPYAIIGKLGAGAMGQVYLARSAAGRLVAVKTIRIELAEEPGFRARFAREVAAASRVSGVFTAAVIEADAEADLPWVATAYVPAPSLSTLVRRTGPLPVPAVRWLAAGCAEALQSIHGVGLLHRDVKPSNVLVAPDGPRLIDFGVARAAERVQLTATRGAAGTPAYMAPEQARDATQASPASDVFSLGATLVFAATGHPPYRGDTVMDILVRLATEPPDLTGMPGELGDLVTACLDRVPRDRPTDAAILAGSGSFASPVSSPARQPGPGEPSSREAAALPAGPGHAYLPDSAMALIAEYQSSPLFPAGDGEDGESAGGATDGSGIPAVASDATSGSDTALPGFHSVAGYGAGFRPPPRRAWRHRLRKAAGADPRPQARVFLPGWPRAVMMVLAVLLVGAGTGLGMALRGSAAQPLGPVAPPPCQPSGPPGSAPRLCVSQPYGDGDTVYVIHGSGFAPFTRVTIRLTGFGASPDRPVTDLQGTFNYAIDQGHYFFPGAIPPGTYRAVASVPGGPGVSASFRVYSRSGAPSPGALLPGPP